jgi:hypothetical protein
MLLFNRSADVAVVLIEKVYLLQSLNHCLAEYLFLR